MEFTIVPMLYTIKGNIRVNWIIQFSFVAHLRPLVYTIESWSLQMPPKFNITLQIKNVQVKNTFLEMHVIYMRVGIDTCVLQYRVDSLILSKVKVPFGKKVLWKDMFTKTLDFCPHPEWIQVGFVFVIHKVSIKKMSESFKRPQRTEQFPT